MERQAPQQADRTCPARPVAVVGAQMAKHTDLTGPETGVMS